MGAVGKFIHSSSGAVVGAACGTSYDAAKRIDVAMGTGTKWRGRLSALYFDGTIGGGAATVTIKGYSDAAGTGSVIIPETAVTLTGDVSGGGGGGVVALEVDLVMDASTTISIFGKTDAGTFTVTNAQIVWEE